MELTCFPDCLFPPPSFNLLFQQAWTSHQKLEGSRTLSKSLFPEPFHSFHFCLQVSGVGAVTPERHPTPTTLGSSRPRVLCFYSLGMEMDTPSLLKEGSWLSEKGTGQRSRGLTLFVTNHLCLDLPTFLLGGYWEQNQLALGETLLLLLATHPGSAPTYRGLILFVQQEGDLTHHTEPKKPGVPGRRQSWDVKGRE